jgi:dihydroorotase
MTRILLRGGRVIDPAGNWDGEADLLLVDGRIAGRARPGGFAAFADAKSIDCTGWWVVPGLIDPHVHLRDPGFPEKETILSGLAAAAAGGFTAVAAMANTAPVNDTPEITRYMLAQAGQVRAARLLPVSAVTRSLAGRELVDAAAMIDAGAQLFSDDGTPIDEEAVLQRAFRVLAPLDRVISLHEEDRRLTAQGAMNAGAVANQLGLPGIPSSAESARVRRDLALARRTQTAVHIAHISTAEVLDLVRAARRDGVMVTCEATPHHFTLDDRAILEFGADAKMSPPLRAARDRDAIRAGLVDGTIDMIATDHAPHDPASKRADRLAPLFHPGRRAARLSPTDAATLATAANGIVGLETALGLTLALVHQQLISPARLVELMAVNPARLLRLPQAGSLASGAAADVTVIDPDYQWTVDPSAFRSRSRNMPYPGMKLKGRATLTCVAGEIVYDARAEERP